MHSDEKFRLVFRGEVLEGQHAAVVKKRLKAALKIDDEQTQRLFAGKLVVLRKDADAPTAARFQRVFREAGARLRVLPAALQDAPEEPTATPQSPAPQSATPQPSPQTPSESVPAHPSEDNAGPEAADVAAVSSGRVLEVADEPGAGGKPSPQPPPAVEHIPDFEVMPVGSDMLPDSEAPAVASPVPSLDFDVAELGSLMIEGAESVEADPSVFVEFELAALGVDLIEGAAGVSDADLAALEIDFDLADVGVDLGQIKTPEPVPAPDVSHLRLSDDS
jgi:hypothetical protein